MKKFKIGDKVRIRKDLKVCKKYGADTFVEQMLCMRGKVATITDIYCDGKKFDIKECAYSWTPEMVEPIPKYKLIFRDNATILIKDGKKYVAKCEAGDTYDREKGLLVALAKANGYNFKEIQEMITNAEIQCKNKQVREVDRRAKIGEYIKIKNAISPMGCYKNGDILKVINSYFEVGVIVDRPNCIQIYHGEYVVLENYKPDKE